MGDPLELMRALAVDWPRTSSHEGLDDACFWCGQEVTGTCIVGSCDGQTQAHNLDCPWLAARRFLNLPPVCYPWRSEDQSHPQCAPLPRDV